MLDRVGVKNFKCLKDVSVRLAPITVLIGANGSGKSSICQCLYLLKQSLGLTSLKVDGPYISLGSINDLFNVDAEPKEIIIELSSKPTTSLIKSRTVSFEYMARFDIQRLLEHRITLRTTGFTTRNWTGGWDYLHGHETPNPTRYEFAKDCYVDLTSDSFVGSALNISATSYPSGRLEYVEAANAIKELIRIPWNVINRIYFVPGLRGVDRPVLGLQDNPVEEFTTGEGLSQQASKLSSTLGYRTEIADIVSSWTNKLLKTKIRHRLAPGRMTSLEILSPRVTINIINDGLGLNQLILPFAQLSIMPSDSTVMIEEPELHLYPKAQRQLVDIFLEVVKQQRKQIILTTHSEHILFQLLMAVAKKEIKPEELAIHHVEKAPEDVASKVTELKVDEKGRLEGGLPGFFEEDLNEFKDYLDALTR